MEKRDEMFLITLNSVYKKFKYCKSVGYISIYTYGEVEIKNIPKSGGDKAFFISKEGVVIFVDYSLITNELINNKMLDIELEKHKDFESRQGRIAGILCFSVLAYRECRNDFNKEAVFFTTNIQDYFIRN